MLKPMNPRSLENPDRDTLERFLREHISARRFVQVAAECEVVYVGRAASLTEAGDYVVLLKADGSVQFVLSLEDPGVPNWLDPVGTDYGMLQFRSYYSTAQPQVSMICSTRARGKFASAQTKPRPAQVAAIMAAMTSACLWPRTRTGPGRWQSDRAGCSVATLAPSWAKLTRPASFINATVGS